VYGSWGATGVQRGDQWAATARTTNNAGVTKRATATSGGGEAISRSGAAGRTTVARTGSGDMYAGHDGNVYRKEGDSFQKYDPGSGWSDTTRQPSEVTRDSAARTEGATRTRDQGTVSSGTSSRSGSYRASGGGGRTSGGGRPAGGGGGRRR
jgi:hypothetical protein